MVEKYHSTHSRVNSKQQKQFQSSSFFNLQKNPNNQYFTW